MSTADLDARNAALLLAVDPIGLRGVIVRGESRAACEAWLDAYTTLLPSGAPVKRIPVNISEERLLGGLDFSATIANGRAVSEKGVLALADGGCVVLSASATRLATWTHVARVLDDHAVTVERDGMSESHAARFAAVALETTDDERCASCFADRVALFVDLTKITRSVWTSPLQLHLVEAARLLLPGVECSDAMLVALTNGAHSLGIGSCRIVLLALAVARANAALHSRIEVASDDIVVAARLVYALRATEVGEADVELGSEQSPQPAVQLGSEQSSSDPNSSNESEPDPNSADVMADVVIRAARSALPSGMLAAAAARAATGKGNAGRAGAELLGGNRGRQVGTRRGDPRGGARLDLVATLRAAIPMQRMRRAARTIGKERVVELRRDDFRLRRCATPATTTTLFVVDASGSAALHRLAEAKGAVELMLAEGYARRDRVAVIAFRGTTAELVLPATHALARARRAIAGMPAGGGTPLATALDLATTVVQLLRRDASQIVTVILTDGRANVGRDGKGGRPRAESDALDAAARLGALGNDVVWIDTSPRAEPLSRRLAEALRARYLLLPTPNARGLSDVARAAHNAVPAN
ncbi:MAG: VWA domain-containing protein [Gemmatimonadaceae bacterium]